VPQPANGDFDGTDYSRGHLCPSSDRTTSATDNDATFVFTNVVPQVPNLNNGPWKGLENEERQLARAGKTLFITAGPIRGTGQLRGGINIPSATWKVIVVFDGPASAASVTAATRVIAVIMRNSTSTSGTWETFRTSVRDIEAQTGLDLLSDVASWGTGTRSRPGSTLPRRWAADRRLSCRLAGARTHRRLDVRMVGIAQLGHVLSTWCWRARWCWWQRGTERTLTRGDVVKVPPEVTRKFVTRAQGVTLLALGGTPGKAYAPSRRLAQRVVRCWPALVRGEAPTACLRRRRRSAAAGRPKPSKHRTRQQVTPQVCAGPSSSHPTPSVSERVMLPPLPPKSSTRWRASSQAIAWP
jgi:hypothetical protein